MWHEGELVSRAAWCTVHDHIHYRYTATGLDQFLSRFQRKKRYTIHVQSDSLTVFKSDSTRIKCSKEQNMSLLLLMPSDVKQLEDEATHLLQKEAAHVLLRHDTHGVSRPIDHHHAPALVR